MGGPCDMQQGKLRSQEYVNMAQSGILWNHDHTTYHAVIYMCFHGVLHRLGMEIHCKLWLLLKNYSFRGELNYRISEWYQRV